MMSSIDGWNRGRMAIRVVILGKGFNSSVVQNYCIFSGTSSIYSLEASEGRPSATALRFSNFDRVQKEG